MLSYNNFFKISYTLFLLLLPITIFFLISGYNQFLGFFLVIEITAVVLINITVLEFKFNYFSNKYNRFILNLIIIVGILLSLYFISPIDIINMNYYLFNNNNNQYNNINSIFILLFNKNYYMFLISISFLLFTLYIVYFINNKNQFIFKYKKNILINDIININKIKILLKNKIEFFNFKIFKN